MICPFATYRPITVNHGGTMSGHIGFVVHVQQGNGSLYGYFSNPSAQVSAHFWCSKTGVLEQYLDTGIVAWAEVAGNSKYISCEFEGFDTEPMTAQQMSQGHNLAAWTAGSYGFPLTGPVAHGSPGVAAHCNPNGTPDPAWGNHSCPGSIRLGQIPALCAGPTPPPIPVPPPTKEPRSDGTMMHDITIPTTAAGQSNAGCGWVQTTIPWSSFLSISVGGSAPARDGGYWPAQAEVNNTGEQVLVTVTGAVPGAQVLVHINATS